LNGSIAGKPWHLHGCGTVRIEFQPEQGWGTWSDGCAAAAMRSWKTPFGQPATLPPEGIGISRNTDISGVKQLIGPDA
jgi:hypothetical protein